MKIVAVKEKKISRLNFFIILLMLCSCASSKKTFDPNKKFSPQQLKADYDLFCNILKESHPGLYWYTSKDSLNYYFNAGYKQIQDSMTEPQFRSLLSYVISKINCGHTTTKYSIAFAKYLDTVKVPIFPIAIKFLEDTAVVSANINKRDTVLRPGVIINRINNIPITVIRDSLMQYISADGYNTTHKRQVLSNGFAFGSYLKNNFDNVKSISINYSDYNNINQNTAIPLYKAVKDSAIKKQMAATPGPNRRERRKLNLKNDRALRIDTLKSTAILQINTFTAGKRLKHFIRRSFHTIKQQQLKNLIVDIRNNGGGDVTNSTLLTKFLANKKFKLADSLYAVKKTSHYGRYIRNSFIVWPFMTITTRKHSDGFYHFGFYERHYFKPHKHNHFDGNVYILTGGNSFSAATLFAGALKGQRNVCLVGEETGGAQYGNCAWFIPDVTLPNTKVRFRLPKFRLVINKNYAKTGHGIMPDVEAIPTTISIANGQDLKMAKALELIEAKE